MVSLRVLALASYPERAAATRFRLCQMVRPLADHGIALDVSPFLDDEAFSGFYQRSSAGRSVLGVGRGVRRRVGDLRAAKGADVVLLQREAAILGPPVVEALLARRGMPMVLDLDDPIWVSYDSPTFGRAARAVK